MRKLLARLTTTTGGDQQSNGLAETTIAQVAGLARTIIASVASDTVTLRRLWPHALAHAAMRLSSTEMVRMGLVPPIEMKGKFGEALFAKPNKNEARGEMEPSHFAGAYLGPDIDVHGASIVTQINTPAVDNAKLKNVDEHAVKRVKTFRTVKLFGAIIRVKFEPTELDAKFAGHKWIQCTSCAESRIVSSKNAPSKQKRGFRCDMLRGVNCETPPDNSDTKPRLIKRGRTVKHSAKANLTQLQSRTALDNANHAHEIPGESDSSTSDLETLHLYRGIDHEDVVKHQCGKEDLEMEPDIEGVPSDSDDDNPIDAVGANVNFAAWENNNEAYPSTPTGSTAPEQQLMSLYRVPQHRKMTASKWKPDARGSPG